VTKFRAAPRSINLWVFIGLWFAAVSVHAAYYVSSILEAGGIQEWYAQARRYQLLMFAIVRLPFWLAVLLGILALRAPSQSDA
jgi:hypothetical protein